jgi:hypothetical protein
MVKSCHDFNFTSVNITVPIKYVYLHTHPSTMSGTKNTPLHLFNNSTNSSAICKRTILKFYHKTTFSAHKIIFNVQYTHGILTRRNSQGTFKYGTATSSPRVYKTLWASPQCHFMYMYNNFLGWGGGSLKKTLPIISCYTSYMPIFQINCIS